MNRSRLARASDADLIAAALARPDSAPFGELVRRYQSALRGWTIRLCRDPALADDIAQNTFVQAYEKLRQAQDPARFQSWLFSIAYREYLQHRRRDARYREVQDAYQREFDDTAADSPDTDDLERILNALSDAERAVFELHYRLGMAHGEIVTTLDMPLGTVKSHLKRGKDRIRKHLGLEGTANPSHAESNKEIRHVC